MALPFTDAFTDANGTALTTHNASYANVNGAYSINTNSAHSNTASTETCCRWNGDTFNNDQYSQIKLVALGGGYIGAAVRAQSGSNGYYGYYSDDVTDATLFKVVGGTWTSIQTGAAAAVNDVLRIEAIGNQITAYKNGVAQTINDHASGYGAITGFGSATTARGDDLDTGNLGSIKRMMLLGVG